MAIVVEKFDILKPQRTAPVGHDLPDDYKTTFEIRIGGELFVYEKTTKMFKAPIPIQFVQARERAMYRMSEIVHSAIIEAVRKVT